MLESIKEIIFPTNRRLIHSIVLTLLFLISLYLYLSYVGMFDQIHRRPCSIHSSAQCTRASIALNYYETDMNFFKPRVMRFYGETGITGVEFPIVYYATAVCYKLFGFNEMYFRIIVLSTLIIGLIYFNLLMYSYIKNYLLSILLVGSVFLSPVLLFYSDNFSPDPSGLGFSLASWYFFFKYIRTNSNKSLGWFTFFITLAGLIKITSLIVIGVVIGLLILDRFKFFKKDNRTHLFEAKKMVIYSITICVLTVASWYLYARWLTKHYGTDGFALEAMPMDSWATFLEVADYIKQLWLFHYYPYESYVLFGAVILVLVICYKLVDRLLFTVTFLTLLGNLFFIYFFLWQFKNHDYYIIGLLSFFFLLFLIFADVVRKLSVLTTNRANIYLKRENLKLITPFIMYVLVVIIIFFNAKEGVKWNKENFQGRYSRDIYYWTKEFIQYEDLEPKLRKLGIKRDDLTLSGFDFTFCNSLYLMNQNGAIIEETATKEALDNTFILNRYKYMILNDTARFNSLYKKDLRDKIIGYHRGLVIYKLF